jgi:hypothetical protein
VICPRPELGLAGMKTCKRCGEPAVSKELCRRHYREARAAQMPECGVPGCQEPSAAQGLCRAHYARRWRHGDPLKGRPIRPIDRSSLEGERIGMLVILERVAGKRGCVYRVACDCGNELIQRASDLKRARRNGWGSCGCQVIARHTTHGLTGHPLYETWRSMKARCYEPKRKSYPDYGGRGITICDRWLDPEDGLKHFIEDMGSKPTPKHSIDRINNDGPYEPGNCRWATSAEQNSNQRRRRPTSVASGSN